MDVQIINLTEDKRPKKVIFRFDAPLDDASFIFVEWTKDGYLPFNLPKPGKPLTLKG